MKRILFVDDERDLLDSLRDALRRYRKVWSVSFATGAEAALAALDCEPADVVVSDMKMPGMDGAALLALVQERHPSTIRIVLSGYADPASVARAATVAHRFLAKPCQVDELRRVVQRSFALHELTERAQAYRTTVGTTTLPSRPGLYVRITEVLADMRTTPDQIAEVIECDTAMTAKLLQLANSAFFGNGRTIARVREAVVYLGGDTIKALTLSSEAFAKLAPSGVEGFSLDQFQRHSALVARIAGHVLPDGPARGHAITAAILHDIGKLVLVGDDPADWRALTEEARRRRLPIHLLEQEQRGVTHAAIGAYLLRLWGLPDGVAEAVAHHHEPAAVPGPALDAIAAVHIAEALANEAHAQPEDAVNVLDEDYIDELGIANELAGWREFAAATAGEGADG